MIGLGKGFSAFKYGVILGIEASMIDFLGGVP